MRFFLFYPPAPGFYISPKKSTIVNIFMLFQVCHIGQYTILLPDALFQGVRNVTMPPFFRVLEISSLLFMAAGTADCAPLFYGVGNVRFLLRSGSRAYLFRGYKISKCLYGLRNLRILFRGCGICNIFLGAEKMKDTAAACPGVLPVCSGTLPGYQYFLVFAFQGVQNVLIHILFSCRFLQDFSCARIVSTNSALPGKSRLFPLRLYRVIKPLFYCAFLCIFALFLSHVYRVKKLFFCSNFLELSSCALSCCKTLFCSTFRNIQRINLFFCAHFCAFYIFPPSAAFC